MKLSQGDPVIVISGKDKGKKGTVLRVLSDQHRVVISDVNMVTKHVKKTAENAGRVVRFEASISAGKVMIIDPKTGKRSRIGYKFDALGHKVRFAKRSGTVLGRVKLKREDEAISKIVKAPAKAGEETKAKTAKTTEVQEKEMATKTVKPFDSARGKPRTPFWKKIGFGSDVATQTDAGTKPDSAPSGPTTSQMPSRSASRGS